MAIYPEVPAVWQKIWKDVMDLLKQLRQLGMTRVGHADEGGASKIIKWVQTEGM